MAFDCTYLTPTHSQVLMRGKHALIGGVWDVHDQGSSFVDLQSETIEPGLFSILFTAIHFFSFLVCCSVSLRPVEKACIPLCDLIWSLSILDVLGSYYADVCCTFALFVVLSAKDLKGLPKASTMLEMVAWDPMGVRKDVLPVCSLPVHHNFAGVHGSLKGCWTMMEIVGQTLRASGKFMRGIVFDSHGTHVLIRKVVHGQFSDVNMQDLKKVPFFGALQHTPLPPNVLPRCPIQTCLHNGDVFYAMPGPCSSMLAVYEFPFQLPLQKK